MKEPIRSHSAIIQPPLLVVCFLLASTSVSAQKIGQPYPPAKSLPSQGNAAPIDPRAPGGGDSVSESRRRERPEDTETVLLRRQRIAQLSEDFQRLKLINKEKLLPLSWAQSLNFKEISQTAAVINSRAKRIKSNTPISLQYKKGDKLSYDESDDRLAAMMIELSKAIDTFLDSSGFQTVSANNNESSSNAGRDLEIVIRLSASVNKIAKRLAKPSA
jgi:hypothetical protein